MLGLQREQELKEAHETHPGLHFETFLRSTAFVKLTWVGWPGIKMQSFWIAFRIGYITTELAKRALVRLSVTLIIVTLITGT